MAHQQNGKTNHEQQTADSDPQPVPPTHVVIEPSPAIESLKAKTNDEKQATEKPGSPLARSEWVIVYITGFYALIAGWTLAAIYKQARWAKKQAKLMEDQLAEMSRQTGWLIEKDRPRLSIELDLYDPLQQPNIKREYCVSGSVSIYGHTVAKVQKAEIRVGTVKSVAEEALSLYSQDVALADFMKSPDNIDSRS